MIKLLIFDLWGTLIYEDFGYGIKEYPHSIPMLKKLQSDAYKTGLISNSGYFAIEKVREVSDIFKYIDYKIFPFDVGTTKPDFKIYNEMLKISGHSPNEVIMIGDSQTDDVEPAKKLGMQAILFLNYEQLKNDLEKYNIFI